MYTQCPRCRTVFGVTDEQLRARAGMVRCGRCRAVFQADAALSEEPPSPGIAPPARHEPVFVEAQDAEAEIPLAALPEESPQVQPRSRRWPWGLGVGLLVLTLIGQSLWMERTTLLLEPQVHALASRACRALGCRLFWREDIAQIELRRVSVTTHPKYRQALRVAFTLVNRARVGQPYPTIELSLLDPEGAVLARRSYGPSAYGRDPQTRMTPNVADRIHFGVTRPGMSHGSLSYELRIYPRRASLP
ncbi:MAG TPA: DUF3426 domain-containing protein [Acidiferrobacteraceae bacterium]|nr:DUF3426 domain-containing protein [Acidiferrobacteraceae bacterium]